MFTAGVWSLEVTAAILGTEPQGLRPAQVPRRLDQGDAGDLQGALRGVRLGRPSRQDQADLAGRDVDALCQGRIEGNRQVINTKLWR